MGVRRIKAGKTIPEPIHLPPLFGTVGWPIAFPPSVHAALACLL